MLRGDLSSGSVACADVEEILIAGGNLRVLFVVAHTIIGLVATGNNRRIIYTQDWFAFHQRALVVYQCQQDIVVYVHIVGHVERIGLARILVQIEQERWIVLRDAITRTRLAVEVV